MVRARRGDGEKWQRRENVAFYLNIGINVAINEASISQKKQAARDTQNKRYCTL